MLWIKSLTFFCKISSAKKEDGKLQITDQIDEHFASSKHCAIYFGWWQKKADRAVANIILISRFSSSKIYKVDLCRWWVLSIFFLVKIFNTSTKVYEEVFNFFFYNSSNFKFYVEVFNFCINSFNLYIHMMWMKSTKFQKNISYKYNFNHWFNWLLMNLM